MLQILYGKPFLRKEDLEFPKNFFFQKKCCWLSFRNSLLYFYVKYTRKYYIAYYIDFLLCLFVSRKYLFGSFDLFISAFFRLLVMILQLLARINFCILGACLSNIGKNISVNSDKSAFFTSISNSSLFSFL